MSKQESFEGLMFVGGMIVGVLLTVIVAHLPIEEPLASEATIACPIGSGFSFVRTVDHTVIVTCNNGN